MPDGFLAPQGARQTLVCISAPFAFAWGCVRTGIIRDLRQKSTDNKMLENSTQHKENP